MEYGVIKMMMKSTFTNSKALLASKPCYKIVNIMTQFWLKFN